jgi:hypothetical protein
VLENTRAQVALMRPDPLTSALRTIVGDLMKLPAGNRLISEMLTGVGIRYDLGDDDPLVGTLVKDQALALADGTEARLYALMERRRRHLRLAFGAVAPARRAAGAHASRSVDAGSPRWLHRLDPCVVEVARRCTRALVLRTAAMPSWCSAALTFGADVRVRRCTDSRSSDTDASVIALDRRRIQQPNAIDLAHRGRVHPRQRSSVCDHVGRGEPCREKLIAVHEVDRGSKGAAEQAGAAGIRVSSRCATLASAEPLRASMTAPDAMQTTATLPHADRLDLEYCGVRHAFYDAMFWRCICPLPAPVADRMERAYLDALRAAGWQLDDERAAGEMVAVATHRMLWMLSWNMTALFEADRDWARPGLSTRGALLRYLDDYLEFATPRPHDPALLTPLAKLRDGLAGRWPRLTHEPFAALRDERI